MVSDENSSENDQPSWRILLVDDDESNRDVESRMLSRLGVLVDCAASGPQALELLESGNYVLVFLDWYMPGMDGPETLARLRLGEKGRSVPVIGLSGQIVEQETRPEQRRDFNAFLTKPVRMAQFRETLEQWLPGYRGP